MKRFAHPSISGFLIAALFMASTAFFGWDWYDRNFRLPFKNVDLVLVERVDTGYRVAITFDKVSGVFKEFSASVIVDGLPRRARYIDLEQPEGVPENRPEGENLVDIIVLTGARVPEEIVLRVRHELMRDGKTYIETNEFIRINEAQLQGF